MSEKIIIILFDISQILDFSGFINQKTFKNKIWWPVLFDPKEKVLLQDSCYGLDHKIHDEHSIIEGHRMKISHSQKAGGNHSRHQASRVAKKFRHIRK